MRNSKLDGWYRILLVMDENGDSTSVMHKKLFADKRVSPVFAVATGITVLYWLRVVCIGIANFIFDDALIYGGS